MATHIASRYYCRCPDIYLLLLLLPQAKSGLYEFDDQADDVGIEGVRFKRIIMDDTGLLPKVREAVTDGQARSLLY